MTINDKNKIVFCHTCKKVVPKKALTEEAIRRGFGLCSRKCSEEMRKHYGNLIPNRIGKYKVKERKKDKRHKKEILASTFGVVLW